MSVDNEAKLDKEIKSLKNTLEKYKKISSADIKLINDIEKTLFENKKKELEKAKITALKNSFDTLKEHQTYTAIAIHPFLEINGKTAISNHNLIELDPFISPEDEDFKKNFDVLILNTEVKCTKLIFLETKSSFLSANMLKDIIAKIEFYESYEMQEFIKNYFRDEYDILNIEYIEYVLLIQPERNDIVREKLKNRNINIERIRGKKEPNPIPLIIWNIIRSPKPKRFNYYYILYNPFNDNISEGITLRQRHRNEKLIKYFDKKDECNVTDIIRLKFSPVLDLNYQLAMATIELIKIYGKEFLIENLQDILREHLLLNLKNDVNIGNISNKIIQKGLKIGLFAIKEEDKYDIKLNSLKSSHIIEEDIIEKISAYKVKKEMNKTEVKIDLLKKVKEAYLSDPRRTAKTLDFYAYEQK